VSRQSPFVLAGAAILFVATGILAVRPLVPPVSSTDFDGFWEGGRAVLEGRDIYENPAHEDSVSGSAVRRYLPFFSVAMAPLAALPLPVAGAVWHAVAFASLWGCLRLSLQWTGREVEFGSNAFLVVTAAAGVFCLDHFARGQVALPVLFLALAGLYVAERGKSFLGGALIALAAALKVTPAIFVLYFLLKRRWMAAAGLVAGFALLCALTVPVFGPGRAFDLHKRWLLDYGMTAGAGFFEKRESMRFNNASLPAVLARILMEDVNAGRNKGPFYVNVAALSPAAVAGIARVIQFAALGALGLLAFARRPGEPLRLSEIGFVLGITALFTPIAWTFHFVCLVPAFAALWCSGDRISRRWFWAAVALELTLLHPMPRALGGVLLADLAATVGVARLAWKERRTPAQD